MNLGVSWPEAGAVVISAVGMYGTFLVLTRLAGQRSAAAMSSFDLAASVAFGAVLGRAILGYTPTLLAGVIGLVTLFGMQAALGRVRRNPRGDAVVNNRPLLLMLDGRVLDDSLRQAHMVEDELREKLRLAGIRRYGDIAYVILERNGAISVLRRGDSVGPELLVDVRRPGASAEPVAGEPALRALPG